VYTKSNIASWPQTINSCFFLVHAFLGERLCGDPVTLLGICRIKGGVDLTWEAGSACLKEAGRRQSNRFRIMHVECLSKACDWWIEM